MVEYDGYAPAHCETCAGKPGASDSVVKGCTCAVMDSHRGHAGGRKR